MTTHAGYMHGKADTTYRMFGCSLQQISGVWEAITTSAFGAIGVESVAVVSSDRIRVTYNFAPAKIGCLIAVGDETTPGVGLGLRVGVDAHLTYADVFLYEEGSSTPINPATITPPLANVWVWGIFEM